MNITEKNYTLKKDDNPPIITTTTTLGKGSN
jgi:hypothetical protein